MITGHFLSRRDVVARLERETAVQIPHRFDVAIAPKRPQYMRELEVLILQQVVPENHSAAEDQRKKTVKVLWHSVCARVVRANEFSGG
jgi:hypothetical protein